MYIWRNAGRACYFLCLTANNFGGKKELGFAFSSSFWGEGQQPTPREHTIKSQPPQAERLLRKRL